MPEYMDKYKQHHSGEFQEEISFKPGEKRPDHNYLKNKDL